MNSPEGLKQLLQEAQIPADSREARKLPEYLTLLRKWNPHINLTASTEWSSLCLFYGSTLGLALP